MERILPNTIRELVNDAIQFGLNGENIDVLVAGLGVNVLLNWKEPKPALVVHVANMSALEVFKREGKVNTSILADVPCFFSIFGRIREEFPLARVYMLAERDLLEFAGIGRSLEARGVKIVPMTPDAFMAAIEANGHERRVAEYCQNYLQQTKGFSGLIDGRTSSTFVKHGFIFNSRGCLFCGRDADLLTTTIGDPENGGMIIGFYACPDHAADANNDASYYHFLTKNFGHTAPMIAGQASREFLVEATAEFMRTQLDCQIEKVENGTITGVRPSGFRLIVRMGKDGGYAYVFLNASGHEVAKIDSANHHNVPYGPDHLHRGPKKTYNRNVIPSFTYGIPLADVQIIRRTLSELNG